MSFRSTIRIQKLQNRHHMVGKSFSTLAPNERRKSPWLASYWFEPGREQERAERIAEWEAETERLKQINPKLVIV